jgi:hypothetical protein
MLKFTVPVTIEIDEDEFSDRYNSAPSQVMYWLLEHGSAGVEFDAYWEDPIKYEFVQETV